MNAGSKTERRLQIVLREEHRNEAGRASVIDALGKLGMTGTGEGTATVAARAPEDVYEGLVPEGLGMDGGLRVPKELAKFVISITEAPDHLYF